MQQTRVVTGRSGDERPIQHLNQVALARPWGVSPRKLEGWRWLKVGPRYLKIGGHVAYTLAEIEMFERASARVGA